jgi:hypothetical protein
MESTRETLLVLIDANRSKGSQLEVLNWALKSVVRSKDTIIALGVNVLMIAGGKLLASHF